jgi:hypothetical protein
MTANEKSARAQELQRLIHEMRGLGTRPGMYGLAEVRKLVAQEYCYRSELRRLQRELRKEWFNPVESKTPLAAPDFQI